MPPCFKAPCSLWRAFADFCSTCGVGGVANLGWGSFSYPQSSRWGRSCLTSRLRTSPMTTRKGLSQAAGRKGTSPSAGFPRSSAFLMNSHLNSKSPAVGADCGAHEERLVCGRLARRPRERQWSRGYSWMRVPERPAMVSAALSRAPMMQVRPLRERANLMAARTLGSMEPLPN